MRRMPNPSRILVLTSCSKSGLFCARKEIVRAWKVYYDYSKRYSESILDTIDVLCIPTLHINIYQYPERDFTVMDSLFSSLLFSKKKRLPGCVYDEIMWYKDTLCLGNFEGIYIRATNAFDSLAHIRWAGRTGNEIAFRAIRKIKLLNHSIGKINLYLILNGSMHGGCYCRIIRY